MHRLYYIAWLIIVFALCAYAAVGYFAWTIAQEKQDRTALLADAQETLVRQAAAARLHGLVVDTVDVRKGLEALVPADVISIAGLIQDVGKSTGVSLELSNALQESSESGSDSVHAVGFVIQGEGSFSALMQTLALLETLPIASSIQRFDIQRTSSDPTAKAVWRMSLHIRALTSASISS